MTRFVPPLQRGRAWPDVPLLAKGLLVIALPVIALVSSSVLVLSTSGQHHQAAAQRDAAAAVEVAVGRLREVSRNAATTFGTYLQTRDAETGAWLEELRSGWQESVRALEAAALAQPDETLRHEVQGLHTASDELTRISDGLLAARRLDPSLLSRATVADRSFQEAMQAISEHAGSRARAFARQHDEQTVRANHVVFVTALAGAVSAVIAMIVFILSVRRRVRRLELNARALGAGEPLQELDHSADELGQLGSGLDHAAALLRDREEALHAVAETLRQNEQRLSLALDSGAMGAWDVDLLSRVSTWDTRTEEDHGLAPGRFAGTFEAWLDLVHPDDRAAVMGANSEAMAHGGRWTSEYRLNRLDGELRWIQTHGQVLADPDGAPVRLVGVSSDITDRKLNDENLRAAIEEAERANRTKTEFLSRVSHELRTPLNAILGFGQLLELDDLEASQQESVDQVLRGGRHLLALIDDVLDISRIESGNLPLSVESTGLDELLAETLPLVAAMARDSEIEIENMPGSSLTPHVHADRRRLKQILLNLLSNAVKYNRPGGRVTIRRSAPEPGVVRISVTDTGQGIPADQMERLFTPFDRLGAENTSVDGTGIGLALSQRLAEMMETTLIVETEVGVGTTFAIDLPLAEDPLLTSDADLRAKDLSADQEGPGGTVLYVEDNPSNFRLVQRLLDRRGGIRLLSAPTGAMALSLASRVPIDVVLLDLHLPDIAGVEVLRQLRENPATASTPVIIVSADATPGQCERLREKGANSFLAKPFDLADFARTLDAHLAAGVGAI